MGNITTHKNIAIFVMDILKHESKDHPGVFQEEDAWFFELGNWFTDMSQLRDPYAFISGKSAIWEMKTGISLTNAAQYLDEVMGKPKPDAQKDRDFTYELEGGPVPRNDPKNDGILARWLRLLVFVWGFEVFVHRGKHIPASEFENIFKTFYTQYYPHEHLDCPPCPDGDSPEDRVISNRIGSLVADHRCDTPPMRPKSAKKSGATRKTDSWVRIKLQDEFGHPLSNVKLMLSATDHPGQKVTTDKNGMVEVTGLSYQAKVEVLCPLLSTKEKTPEHEARLENTWTTTTKKVDGHPIDKGEAPPPGSQRKFIACVEPVKPQAKRNLKVLASELSIGWEDLCRFNFGTDIPRKVNLALRDRVGCYRTVDRAGNYTFVGDEKGVIYLPHMWEMKRLGVNQTHVFRATRADGRPVKLPKKAGRGAAKPTRPEGAPTASSSSSRAVLAYLDEHIEFVADLLTFIEHHWKKIARDNLSDSERQIRRRLLVLFGHTCHVVEDFYLHSNFVEIVWSMLRRDLPKRWRNQAEKHRHHRLYYRRLRAPLTKGEALHPENSKDGQSHIFTGFFGAKDVFHTVTDALDGLNEKLKLDDPAAIIRWFPGAGDMLGNRSTEDISKLVEKDAKNPDDPAATHRLAIKEYEAAVVIWDTLGWVASKKRRHRLLHDDPIDEIVGRHHKRLKAGTYDRVFRTLLDHKRLHSRSVDTLKKAFRLDKDLIFNSEGKIRAEWEKGKNLPVGILGTFGFLLTMAQAAEEEHEKSEEKSLDHDRDGVNNKDTKKAYDASCNDATAEDIGSHSLLAKDSPRKEPLREPAINLATRVACFVAQTLASQIVTNKVNLAKFNNEASGKKTEGSFNTINRGRSVDWLHLLQHFLCHPNECEHNWHIEAMDLKPSVAEYLKHNTHYVLRRIDVKTRDERIKQTGRNQLEHEYHAFEEVKEKEWKER